MEREPQRPETPAADTSATETLVRFGPFRFDRTSEILSREDGEEIPLPPRALSLLGYLVDHAGEVVSKKALVDELWRDTHVADASLKEAVSLLRHALGDDPRDPTYIRTVYRRGYRFIAPIEEPSSDDESIDLMPAPTRPRHGASWLAPRFLVLIAGLALVLPWLVASQLAPVGNGNVAPLEPPAVTRFTVAFPDGADGDLDGAGPAITPDGRNLVYAARLRGSRQLFHRSLDSFGSRAIAGTEEAAGPFFSPDGRWLAFFAGGELRKVPLEGGVPVTLCDAPGALGGTWGNDGTIVFDARPPGGLRRVSESGGEPEVLTRPDQGRGETAHGRPRFLPGGRSLVFSVRSRTSENASLAWLALGGGEPKILLRGGGGAASWAATGHLVYSRAGALMAVPFDAEHGELRGEPVTVLEGVVTDPGLGPAHFALSEGGTLVYLADNPLGSPELRIVMGWFEELRRRFEL